MKLVFILFLIWTVSLFPQELKVVKTIPENGAKNVDPLLTEIEIVFSAAVKMNSWSFVETGKGEFPETIDEPYFFDNKTCVLPVFLEPQKTYSIGINSATKKGFKSATDERVTAIPYVLTFTTGKSEDDYPFEDESKWEEQENYQQPQESYLPKAKVVEKNMKSRSTIGKVPTTMIFQRVSERNEKAFSILIPKGWLTEGGIFRVNPTAQGGPSQSIAAKLDFSVKKDQTGTLMIRWLPDVLYYDARFSPAGQMGLYPSGSNYQGMTVYPLMSAQQFLSQIVFPYAHPQVSGVQVVEQKNLTDVAQKYQQRVNAAMPGMTFSYNAGMITSTYQENGVSYKEKMVAIIENWGQLGAGMWGNKETFLLRTPVNEFTQWEPIFSIIQNSVVINSQWLAGEIKGQIQRGQIAIQTQQEVQKIERAIADHRQKTNAEIHNDMFLTLTDQEEYVNPFTNEVEVGSNQWQHRWINEGGDVIYTNDESYDPRVDVNLNRTDYKKTQIRKRFPQ